MARGASRTAPAVDPRRDTPAPVRARVYRAWTMADALAAVRQDLGADAMILHARAISRRGFLGFGRKDFVEVAAAPALPEASLSKYPRRDRVARSDGVASLTQSSRSEDGLAHAARSRGLAAYAEGASTSAPQTASQEAAFDLAGEQAKTRRLAREMLVQLERESAERKAASLNEVATATEASAVRQTGAAATKFTPAGATRETPREVARVSAAQRFVLKSPSGSAKSSSSRGEVLIELQTANGNLSTASVSAQVPSIAASALPSRPTVGVEHVVSELDAIGSIVDAVLAPSARQSPRSLSHAQQLATRVANPTVGAIAPRTALPTEALEAAYRALIEQEVADQLADAILARVAQELTHEQCSDPARVRQSLVASIASMLPATDGDSDSLAHRVLAKREGVIAKRDSAGAKAAFRVAFIGPTGVGKTTSIAKIAAMLRLRHGLQVGLVTADTYRIAAVEQLRTYAQILALPLEVAMQPEDLTAACERLSDCDVVLIDTAGRSQNDKSRLAELGQFLQAGAADEVHLVMSATSSERSLLREAAAFGALGVDRIVLTKLDEAAGFGTLLSVTRKLGMRISFVTTGQEVPKDLEPASAHRLAEFLLRGTTANDASSSARGPGRS